LKKFFNLNFYHEKVNDCNSFISLTGFEKIFSENQTILLFKKSVIIAKNLKFSFLEAYDGIT